MRLSYDKSISADPAPLVLLGPGNTRVEMHIRRDEDDTVTLLAFSGLDGESPPRKTLQQGPYQLHDQAVAAKRAIVAQLKQEGFVVSDSHPLWSLDVQRAINTAREQRRESAGDYRFDPKDVFLDW